MKKILICGASRNLGKYFFENLKKKHQVFLFSRKKINYKNSIKTDISDHKQANNSFKSLKNQISKIDTIIFCIGNSKKNYSKYAKTSDFENSFKNNFYPFVNLIYSYLKHFRGKPVNIIVISSIAGIKNINAPITYSIAKNALNFYSSIMSKELAKNKIYINIISPGNILLKGNNWDKKIKKKQKKSN
jgi:3-oxoacyl-[acyl-carrier protein] reductase